MREVSETGDDSIFACRMQRSVRQSINYSTFDLFNIILNVLYIYKYQLYRPIIAAARRLLSEY